MSARPSISELEAILQREDEVEIEILPNGEVRAKDKTSALERGGRKHDERGLDVKGDGSLRVQLVLLKVRLNAALEGAVEGALRQVVRGARKACGRGARRRGVPFPQLPNAELGEHALHVQRVVRVEKRRTLVTRVQVDERAAGVVRHPAGRGNAGTGGKGGR